MTTDTHSIERSAQAPARASATQAPPPKPIEPMRAVRAIRVLLKDPDDTSQVFEIIDALSGNVGERLFQRFVASDTGRRILDEHRSLLGTLDDRATLSALPEGTLGRIYSDFTVREQITGQGLADASMTARRRDDLDEDRRLFYERLRDMHDLWHVVTGYGRDLVGEASLLAFTYAQTRNRGIGFIVAVAYLRARGDAQIARAVMRDAYRRGKRAAWLPGEDWEELLRLPLETVRRRLDL
ncbi:MAG: Coq4 family protein, partial [Alphaproteobacteria bacterium]